jgi:hypothetical protein
VQVGVKKVPGGSVADSFMVQGVAFKKTFAYAGFEQMSKKFEDPKILLLNVELELKVGGWVDGCAYIAPSRREGRGSPRTPKQVTGVAKLVGVLPRIIVCSSWLVVAEGCLGVL